VLEQQLSRARRQSVVVKRQSAQSGAALFAARRHIAALEEKLEAKDAARAAGAAQVGEASSEQRPALQSALEAARRKLHSMAIQLGGTRRQSVVLESQAAQSRGALGAAQETVGALEAELEKLGAARAQVTALEGCAAAHCEAATAEHAALQSALAAARAELQRSQSELASARRQSVALQGQSDATLASSRAAVATAQQTASALEAELEGTRRQSVSLTSKVRSSFLLFALYSFIVAHLFFC
jgi:chromosome segregation ATPase